MDATQLICGAHRLTADLDADAVLGETVQGMLWAAMPSPPATPTVAGLVAERTRGEILVVESQVRYGGHGRSPAV